MSKYAHRPTTRADLVGNAAQQPVKELEAVIVSEPVHWWASIKTAAERSGFSRRQIEELARAGIVRSSNAKRPGASRGRRLIDMAALFAFIEKGVNEPPAKLTVNAR